ncbi:MAG: hypothetical protein IKV36_03875, partial [Clostridia bacterium]|nr:hypothetical protein [Clostridia bacterium]
FILLWIVGENPPVRRRNRNTKWSDCQSLEEGKLFWAPLGAVKIMPTQSILLPLPTKQQIAARDCRGGYAASQ